MKKINPILFLLVGLIIFINESASQTYLEKDLKNLIREKNQSNINNFILDKVINNRIVMIADGGHGNHIYLQTVINILNYWIDTLQRNLNQEINIRNLYLILEADSVQINSVYNYFSTNNPYDLLNPEFIYGYQFTTAKIEFYDDLRKIYHKVESINKGLPDSKKISLKLFGPEKVINLNDWSVEKRDKYFINERDEFSSDQIINLLDKDSTAKALIFYGGGHLVTVKTQKLQTSQEQGYFLGYYLSNYFKDKGGYYSFDQLSAQNPWLNETYKCSGKNYVIENSIFEGQAIPNNMQPQGTNASLILFDKNINQPHISKIWSDNLVDCFLNNSDNFLNLSSEFNRGIISSWFYYLSIISGNGFENIDFNDSASVTREIDRWKDWRRNKKTNIADEILNQNIIKNRISLFEKSDYPIANRYDFDLWNLLLNAKVWHNRDVLSKFRAKVYYEYIEKYSKPIISENLINLLWVGTIEEKQKALEYLNKTFSLNLKTAKEWTEWWRNSEYCN